MYAATDKLPVILPNVKLVLVVGCVLIVITGIGAAVTAKLAVTVVLALLLPVMEIISLCFPTANPTFGRTVKVAVAPAASVVVESVPIV